jgi:regulator of sirC expression with transglutaminase-like and TPR domain
MSSATATQPPPSLNERQRAALISLLADDDQNVYQTVRTKILSYGRVATEWLQPYTLSSDPVLRRRAQEIVHHLLRQSADEAFMAFCHTKGEDLDVEEGTWMLAKTAYPEINAAAYQALFDNYAGELREPVQMADDPERILVTVNHYLFDKLGFIGNERNHNDPDNSYLNRVVDRRTGIPISLSMVYLFVTRRLHLPVTGIGLPGHFICRYQTAKTEIFIDPSKKGKFLTKADCIKHLLQMNQGLQDGHLAPVSPRRTLQRMCLNLHQIYLHLKQADESARLQRYLVALAK